MVRGTRNTLCADATDLAGTYLPGNLFHWDQAFGGWHSACSWAQRRDQSCASIPRLVQIYLGQLQVPPGLRGRYSRRDCDPPETAPTHGVVGQSAILILTHIHTDTG